MSVFDGVRRVLVAHAHPDDESLAGGALLVALARRGVEVVLLTATRGEQGEVVPGPLSELEGTSALIDERARELAGAAATLGIARTYYLGEPPARAGGEPRRYEDSGMRWVTPERAGPGETATELALTSADAGEVASDLAALITHEQPDLLLTYDADGGYGHPDHVRLHEVSLLAAAQTGTTMAVLTGDEGPEIEWFDAPEVMPVVFEALRHHRTQVTVDPPYVVHSGGQREEVSPGVGVRPIGPPDSESRISQA